MEHAAPGVPSNISIFSQPPSNCMRTFCSTQNYHSKTNHALFISRFQCCQCCMKAETVYKIVNKGKEYKWPADKARPPSVFPPVKNPGGPNVDAVVSLDPTRCVSQPSGLLYFLQSC